MQLRPGDVAARALERALGQLDADRVGARVEQRGDEAPRAAAEVEHALAPLRLGEQERATALPRPRLRVLGQLGPHVLVEGLHAEREARDRGYRTMMRVCFDSRPAADRRGIGRYARCLLEGLVEEAARRGGEIVEGRQPRRRDDVFHAPWMAGALLRPRVPMVVTVHDLVQQKRPGEHLRAGLRGGMRHLALARAARLIVPTHAVAVDAEEILRVAPERIDVIAEAPAGVVQPRARRRRSRPCASATACRRTTCCGSATCATPIRTGA